MHKGHVKSYIESSHVYYFLNSTRNTYYAFRNESTKSFRSRNVLFVSTFQEIFFYYFSSLKI